MIFIILKMMCQDLVKYRKPYVNVFIMCLMPAFLTFIQGTFTESDALTFTVSTITVFSDLFCQSGGLITSLVL